SMSRKMLKKVTVSPRRRRPAARPAVKTAKPAADKPVRLVRADETPPAADAPAAAGEADESLAVAEMEAVADSDDEPAVAEAEPDPTPAPQPASRRDDEPSNFLALYFREMARLSVLRPEQEFESARQIEQLEIELWARMLSHTPLTEHLLRLVERAIDNT